MAKKAAKPSPRDFGSARERLDEILAELEQDGGDVDRLADRIKEASVLIRFCRERLSSARAEVRSVVAELDADQAQDGDPMPVDDDRPPPEEAPPGVPDSDAPADGSLPF